jgi:transposase InsO family protein
MVLSPKAQERLRWLRCFEALRKQGLSSSQASQTLFIPRSTLYRWRKHLKEKGPKRLEDRSRRPKRLRRPTWSEGLAQAVLHLRDQYPRWGKDKLVVLLRREGWQVSTSMVGRILTRLKVRGVLKEPVRRRISTHKRQYPRPYAIRKPQEYQVEIPGELVEVDTLDVRPTPGVVLKQFTARDVVSRWDVMEGQSKATSLTAVGFLEILTKRMPFPIKALQVDGGSEFQAAFEEACRERGIRLFVLPPRSPKLNGHVERAQRTHTEEFYELYDGDMEVVSLNKALQEWEWTYNHYRPHQALDGRSPMEYLIECHPEMASPAHLSHM